MPNVPGGYQPDTKTPSARRADFDLLRRIRVLERRITVSTGGQVTVQARELNVSVTVVGGPSNVTLQVDWGDGTTDNLPLDDWGAGTITRIYDAPGTYYLRVIEPPDTVLRQGDITINVAFTPLYMDVHNNVFHGLPYPDPKWVTAAHPSEAGYLECAMLVANSIPYITQGPVIALGDSWSVSGFNEFDQAMKTVWPTCTTRAAGVGGENMTQMLARWETQVAPYIPSIVVMFHGLINDQADYRTDADIIADIEDARARSTEIGAGFIMLGSAPHANRPGRSDALNPVLQALFA